jgi:hypothetical protein
MTSMLRNRISLLLLLVLLGSVCTLLPARAQQPSAAGRGGQQTAAQPGNCPGKEGPTLYEGQSESRDALQAIVNGKPMGGRWFEAGAHSYWHCHAGGQFMVVMAGKGRAQKRGERMRDLPVGEIEYAGPWVEHWHGAAADSSVQFVQVALVPTSTRWMEQTSQDDYLGNDIGLNSRNQYLSTLSKAK